MDAAIERIIRHLVDGPALLKDLLGDISPERYKVRRIPSKWSIHEHACHLADVEALMYDRLLTFRNVDYPVFQPFIPGTTFRDDHLMTVSLDDALERYSSLRAKTIELARSLEDKDWEKEATHPEYEQYTAKILLRHLLMHDSLHQYRIEQLWLTREAFLLD